MRDKYRIMDPALGKGAFGEVRKCYTIPRAALKRQSAIKQYKAVKILSKAYMSDKEFQSFKNEVQCMKLLDHPNILKCVHFFEDDKRYMLITDLCEGGELLDLIKKEGSLPQAKAAAIIKQILSALNFMHNDNGVNEQIQEDAQIVHRDLKPENVLLNFGSNDKTGTPEIKLIDFGTAEHVKKEEPLLDRVGTILYMAPEVVNAGKFKTKSGL